MENFHPNLSCTEGVITYVWLRVTNTLVVGTGSSATTTISVLDDFSTLTPIASEDCDIRSNGGGLNKNKFDFEIGNLYPNPSKKTVKMDISLSSQQTVKIEIFNQQNKKFLTWLDEILEKGGHKLEFNTQSLSSGLYYIHSQVGNQFRIEKLLILN